MKTFTDNIARQVIERHIISPLPQAFCPSSVSDLSDKELTEIGSKPKDQSLEQTKLGNKADQLQRSIADLQKTL